MQLKESVLIAPFVHINSGNHGYDDPNLPIVNQEYKKSKNIIVEKGTWLGRNSTLLGGVTLGENCVVGASAVVTKQFPSHSIIVGIPGRKIN